MALGLPGRTGSNNRNTELGALNEVIKKLQDVKSFLTSNTGGISDLIPTKSNLYRLQTEANDLVKTYTWLDGGTGDQRISTIVYSSTLLSLSVTETYTYNGGAGTYHVATSTLS